MKNSHIIKLKAVMKIANHLFAKKEKNARILGTITTLWSECLKAAWKQVKHESATLNRLFKISVCDYVIVKKVRESRTKYVTAFKKEHSTTVIKNLTKTQKANTLVKCMKSGFSYDIGLFEEVFC